MWLGPIDHIRVSVAVYLAVSLAVVRELVPYSSSVFDFPLPWYLEASVNRRDLDLGLLCLYQMDDTSFSAPFVTLICPSLISWFLKLFQGPLRTPT